MKALFTLVIPLLLACGGAVDVDSNPSPIAQGGEPQVLPASAGSSQAGASVEASGGAPGGGSAALGSAGGLDEGFAGGEPEAGAGGQPECIPKTFEEACPPVGGQGMSCGGAPDGCGGVVDCGECSGLNVCDHVQNTCLTCTPTTIQLAQNYCKDNEPEHPKAYQNCAFTFHDCVRVDQLYWCCSF